MTNTVRRLSQDLAATQAKALAVEFAKSINMEGLLLEVRPDPFLTEREGKTPVYWTAVFTSVHRGVELDGPTVLLVDLSAQSVAFSE